MIGKLLGVRISEREIRKMGQIRGGFFRFESVRTKNHLDNARVHSPDDGS